MVYYKEDKGVNSELELKKELVKLALHMHFESHMAEENLEQYLTTEQLNRFLQELFSFEVEAKVNSKEGLYAVYVLVSGYVIEVEVATNTVKN